MLWLPSTALAAIKRVPTANISFTAELYDEAKKKNWTVISMKNDWKRIFAFE